MKAFNRYAIYFLPKQNSALANFGANWLGWDIQKGQQTDYPSWVDADHQQRVSTPVKYGFHGTIKPPMRLAAGKDIEQLRQHIKDVCKAHQAFELPDLQLQAIGNFLALTLSEPCVALQNLAADCVCELDNFRAEPTPAELQKRLAANLTAQQQVMLKKWGYPYVLDEFKFHLTLTGKLPELEQQQQLALLSEQTNKLLKGHRVEDIALCGEADDGRFYLIERFALG